MNKEGDMDQGVANQPKKKVTKQQRTALIIAGILLVVGVGIAVAVRSGDAVIEKNGTETTATSTGKYLQTREGGRRGKTVYKAQYQYEVGGSAHFVYGEKGFEAPEDIAEGHSTTVKYLPNEPTKSKVTGSE